MSFEDFMKKLRTDVNADIEKANETVEEQLPDILSIKRQNRQRSLLINPDEAQKQLKGMIEERENVDQFLDVVSAVRGEKVEITRITSGDRKDERDFIIKGRNPQTGQNIADLRVLVGAPDAKGTDIRNEVSQAAFYKVLNLRVYREKASFERQDRSKEVDFGDMSTDPMDLEKYRKMIYLHPKRDEKSKKRRVV